MGEFAELGYIIQPVCSRRAGAKIGRAYVNSVRSGKYCLARYAAIARGRQKFDKIFFVCGHYPSCKEFSDLESPLISLAHSHTNIIDKRTNAKYPLVIPALPTYSCCGQGRISNIFL